MNKTPYAKTIKQAATKKINRKHQKDGTKQDFSSQIMHMYQQWEDRSEIHQLWFVAKNAYATTLKIP